MHCRVRRILIELTIAILTANTLFAQVVIQPTPNPTVTAENERWYLNGEPITYAGSFYYPAGPRVYFNPNEMVRSGFHMGIPLYARTTIEPYSVVYLPVGPGVMQPYERPRVGQLAETSGSIPTSLPAVDVKPNAADDPFGGAILQAAGPASQTTTVIPVFIPLPTPVATTGRAADPSASMSKGVVSTRSPMHIRIGGTPQGTNSIYIEFEGERWYKAGAAEPIDPGRMTRAGTYAGVPVWTAADKGAGIIYVPVTQQAGMLAVPYSRKRP